MSQSVLISNLSINVNKFFPPFVVVFCSDIPILSL